MRREDNNQDCGGGGGLIKSPAFALRAGMASSEERGNDLNKPPSSLRPPVRRASPRPPPAEASAAAEGVRSELVRTSEGTEREGRGEGEGESCRPTERQSAPRNAGDT